MSTKVVCKSFAHSINIKLSVQPKLFLLANCPTSLTGKYPSIFGVFRVQKMAEIWHFSGRFGRLSVKKVFFCL